MKYTVNLTNKEFTGNYLSVNFANGIGETDNEYLADRFRRKGNDVTETKGNDVTETDEDDGEQSPVTNDNSNLDYEENKEASVNDPILAEMQKTAQEPPTDKDNLLDEKLTDKAPAVKETKPPKAIKNKE